MYEQLALARKSFWNENWVRQGRQELDLHQYVNYRIAKLLDVYLPKTPSLLMLEVGAGNSVWLPYMAKSYGYSVVGIDYSRIGCEFLKANLYPHLDTALVIEGDIFQGCFRHGTFDVIYSNGFIEHFTNYVEILGLFRSWLKPGGLLITLVPNKKYLFRHVEKWITPDIYETHILLKPEDLERGYKQIGLDGVLTSYLGSFSTWKYTSKTKGIARLLLRVLSRFSCVSVHTVLRASGLEPESKMFSPLIFAVGKVPRAV